MKSEKISELTTNRLSVYLRCLKDLADGGHETVSSEALAKAYNLNSAQIRKDLANFGEFGVRGVGYCIKSLRENLTDILGLNSRRRVCIIGAGRLGAALANYYISSGKNFEVVALFDVDQQKIGKKISDVEVFDVKDFAAVAKRAKIEVAVLAVPAESAQSIADVVMGAGIKAVMNFAPVPLKVCEDVKLKTVDLTTSLDSLSYYLAGADRSNGKHMKPNGGRGRI